MITFQSEEAQACAPKPKIESHQDPELGISDNSRELPHGDPESAEQQESGWESRPLE